MLFTYEYKRHTADKLQYYILIYLRRVRCLPKGTAFDVALFPIELREIVSRRYKGNPVKVYQLFEVFYTEFLELDEVQRNLVFSIFINCNSIKKLLNNSLPISQTFSLDDPNIPNSFKEAAKFLFVHLYSDVLPKIGEIKQHYEGFYKELKHTLKNTWCPFCGIEKLNSYKIYKQDYDHLLNKAKYPLAAINMKNLVPMGHECNRVHKGSTDVLFNDIGVRRSFFYPFEKCPTITIDLDGSTVPSFSNMSGNWVIHYSPNDPEVQTWAIVFNLTKRYKENILEPEFDGWVDQFVQFAREEYDISKVDEDFIRVKFRNYSNSFRVNDYKDMNFIKSAALQYVSANAPSSFFKALIRRIEDIF